MLSIQVKFPNNKKGTYRSGRDWETPEIQEYSPALANSIYQNNRTGSRIWIALMIGEVRIVRLREIIDFWAIARDQVIV